MSLTTAQEDYRDVLEVLGAANGAISADRVISGNPQGSEETAYESEHSGLADDDAREESEYEIVASIIDRTVVPEIDHDSWVSEFDTVVGVEFSNEQTLDAICKRKKRPQT